MRRSSRASEPDEASIAATRAISSTVSKVPGRARGHPAHVEVEVEVRRVLRTAAARAAET